MTQQARKDLFPSFLKLHTSIMCASSLRAPFAKCTVEHTQGWALMHSVPMLHFLHVVDLGVCFIRDVLSCLFCIAVLRSAILCVHLAFV